MVQVSLATPHSLHIQLVHASPQANSRAAGQLCFRAGNPTFHSLLLCPLTYNHPLPLAQASGLFRCQAREIGIPFRVSPRMMGSSVQPNQVTAN